MSCRYPAKSSQSFYWNDYLKINRYCGSTALKLQSCSDLRCSQAAGIGWTESPLWPDWPPPSLNYLMFSDFLDSSSSSSSILPHPSWAGDATYWLIGDISHLSSLISHLSIIYLYYKINNDVSLGRRGGEEERRNNSFLSQCNSSNAAGNKWW